MALNPADLSARTGSCVTTATLAAPLPRQLKMLLAIVSRSWGLRSSISARTERGKAQLLNMLGSAVAPRLGVAPAPGRSFSMLTRRPIAVPAPGIAQQRRRQVGAAPTLQSPVCALKLLWVPVKSLRWRSPWFPGRSSRWRHRLGCGAAGFPLACPPAFPARVAGTPNRAAAVWRWHVPAHLPK